MKGKNLNLPFLPTPTSATPTEESLDRLDVLFYNFALFEEIEEAGEWTWQVINKNESPSS